LNVTRKIYLPQDGYFARYLEILTNPGSTPVTVDLRVTSNMRPFNGTPLIQTTSSGDNILDVSNPINPDHWVVIGDVVMAIPSLIAASYRRWPSPLTELERPIMPRQPRTSRTPDIPGTIGGNLEQHYDSRRWHGGLHALLARNK